MDNDARKEIIKTLYLAGEKLEQAMGTVKLYDDNAGDDLHHAFHKVLAEIDHYENLVIREICDYEKHDD